MLKDTFAGLGLSETVAGIVLIVLGIAMIFFVIIYISKLLKVLMVGRANEILHSAVGLRSPVRGLIVVIFEVIEYMDSSVMIPIASVFLVT